MANSGPNPEVAIADHIPGRIQELEDDLERAVANVLKIQTALVRSRTLLLLSPQEPEKPVKSGARPSAGETQ